MRKQIRVGYAVVLTAALMFATLSCDKEPVDQRPELPPVESMMMDFSDFSEQPATSKGTINSHQNFTRSYFTVGFWNISATVVSALPVAAYAHALQQEAEYLGDNTWEWSYDFSLNGASYAATLNAMRLSNEEFSVDMSIAMSAFPNQGVKWFDGVVRYDHTRADWTFYKDGEIPVLEIGWNKDFETEAADLTYTYAEPDQKESSSFIMWKYLPGMPYDAAYMVSMADGVCDIQWNTSSLEGRIMEPVFFGDNAWHCWDSHANGLADIECE